jgi:hypothetical protein
MSLFLRFHGYEIVKSSKCESAPIWIIQSPNFALWTFGPMQESWEFVVLILQNKLLRNYIFLNYKYLDLRDRKQYEGAENYIMRGYIICTLYQK